MIAPAVTDPLVLTLVTDVLPNCMVLLAVTIAPLPIAVALVKSPEPTSALAPIAVFPSPVVIESNAVVPIETLFCAVEVVAEGS